MDNIRTATLQRPPNWVLLSVIALAFTLAHVMVDLHIGLFGESSNSMAPLQAANLFLTGLVVAWWSATLALAVGGSSVGFSGAFVMAIGWAFLNHGAVPIAVAPPPSAAFPYQDISHFGSLIFGGWAAYAVWREMRTLRIPFERRSVIFASGVILITAVVGGVVALSHML
jgi:hypothetical protein